MVKIKISGNDLNFHCIYFKKVNITSISSDLFGGDIKPER